MMFCAAALTAATQGGEAGGRSREAERALEKVWEPRIVAVPPAAAVRDMCVTAGGQIRHYGFIADGQTKKRVYAASDDCGMSWRTVLADPADAGAMVRSPWSGEWIYFTGREPVTLVRSKTGPGDTAATVTPMPWKHLELRQLTPLKSRKRWLAAFSDVTCENGECYHAVKNLLRATASGSRASDSLTCIFKRWPKKPMRREPVSGVSISRRNRSDRCPA